MTKPGINHPFQVPDDFFDHLGKDLLTELDEVTLHDRKKPVLLQFLKYAAIFIGAILLGRESVKLYPGETRTSDDRETISVDLVLSQVSDEDITDFFIENFSEETLTEN